MSKEHSFELDDKLVSHHNGQTHIIAELLKNNRGLYYYMHNYSTGQNTLIAEDDLIMDYYWIGKSYDPIKKIQ